MPKQEHRVSVENGKYTFASPSDSFQIHVLRHGELWVGQADAPKAVYSMMAELDAARVVLAAARTLAAAGVAPPALVEALTNHDALVDDQGPPSPWTVP